MTEWGVVGVIIALIGLGTAIVKPLITLNTSIVSLTSKLEQMGDNLADISSRNTKSHERLWAHNNEQDDTLGDHERRITVLEHDK
jgi:hypothetical protein